MRVYGRARVWSCECVCLCEGGYVDLGFSWLHVFLCCFCGDVHAKYQLCIVCICMCVCMEVRV